MIAIAALDVLGRSKIVDRNNSEIPRQTLHIVKSNHPEIGKVVARI